MTKNASNQNARLDGLLTNQNARLDYLQTIEYKIRPGTVPPPMRIYVQKRQRAELRLTSVLRNPVGNYCSFEYVDDKKNLLNVSIGRENFLKCPQTANSEEGCSARLDGDWWTKYGSEFHGQMNLFSTLQFERAPELIAPCSIINVEGTFAVYKDVVP